MVFLFIRSKLKLLVASLYQYILIVSLFVGSKNPEVKTGTKLPFLFLSDKRLKINEVCSFSFKEFFAAVTFDTSLSAQFIMIREKD